MSSKVSRRLAAILAADIAGDSRLMGEDEAATVRDLEGQQAEVLPLVAESAAASSTWRATASWPSFKAPWRPWNARCIFRGSYWRWPWAAMHRCG